MHREIGADELASEALHDLPRGSAALEQTVNVERVVRMEQ
jgi:hypothetical protein